MRARITGGLGRASPTAPASNHSLGTGVTWAGGPKPQRGGRKCWKRVEVFGGGSWEETLTRELRRVVPAPRLRTGIARNLAVCAQACVGREASNRVRCPCCVSVTGPADARLCARLRGRSCPRVSDYGCGCVPTCVTKHGLSRTCGFAGLCACVSVSVWAGGPRCSPRLCLRGPACPCVAVGASPSVRACACPRAPVWDRWCEFAEKPHSH